MCAFERRPYFEDRALVEVVREQLLHPADACTVEILAYVFMPDHLHALVTGTTEASDSKRYAEVFRQRSSFHVRRVKRERLWQEGYFDRVLRAEEDTVDVVRYLIANPLRAGLCTDVREYPFIGSQRYSIEELIEFVQTVGKSR